jgi:hypothetical protein
MGLGKNPRYRRIIDEERRALNAHIAEIQAEQEQRNAALHEIDHSHIPLLRIAEHTIGRRLTGELETTVMAGFVLPSILNG